MFIEHFRPSSRSSVWFLVALFLLLTILAAASFFFFFKIPQPVADLITKAIGVSSSSPTLQITYSDTGFTPERIEIQKGTRVIFKNTSSIPMWVASDPHPIHSDYSVFDAKRDYTPEEAYEFTFNETGAFSYHNHSSHHHRGFIRVTDPAKPLLDIDKTIPAQQAIRDKLVAMLDPNDVDTIFAIIDTIQADTALALNCHDIAHDVGHRAYELYGFSDAMTFSNPQHVDHPLVQYICAGGYMHGILEQLSLHQSEYLTNPSILCAAVSEADRSSCFHGIGHVFMLAHERDIAASIGNCRVIDDTTDMYRCFEGVRMEQFWGSNEHTASSSLGWDLEEPLASCVAAKTDEKPTCFLYSSFGYLRIHPKDYPGAVRLCTQSYLPELDAEFCLKGLGITMMSKFKGQHLEGSEVYVAALSEAQRHAFYLGVLGYARLSGVDEATLTRTCGLFRFDQALCLTALEDSR